MRAVVVGIAELTDSVLAKAMDDSDGESEKAEPRISPGPGKPVPLDDWLHEESNALATRAKTSRSSVRELRNMHRLRNRVCK